MCVCRCLCLCLCLCVISDYCLISCRNLLVARQRLKADRTVSLVSCVRPYRLIAVYSSMRRPAVADYVDAESHVVDAGITQPEAAAKGTYNNFFFEECFSFQFIFRAMCRTGQRGRPNAPSRTPTKKLFGRLSATSTAISRPASARSASTSAAKRPGAGPRRPQSAPRERPSIAVSVTTISQQSHRATKRDAKQSPSVSAGVAGSAGGRRTPSGPRGARTGREEEEQNTAARASVHLADLMDDALDQRTSSGSPGGGRRIETAVSVSDFLPRHTPPPANAAGLRQWCGQTAELPEVCARRGTERYLFSALCFAGMTLRLARCSCKHRSCVSN